ncbi:MAG: inositol-3-phosphate synthase [Deltaproteobacteria bacterium]|jgi:myo-inositol-1-phosphate synthase|nr:MAG: inositol-3-phosphate synthase [Deltaproteobacteria bacterium]
MKNKSIKIAVVGVGNCTSALLQGIEFYKNNPGVSLGLMHYDLGGYTPSDIEVVAAFDIDKRKVGKPLEKAVFAPPNCTRTIWEDLPSYGVTVSMGRVLDGVSEHMSGYPPERTFLVADEEPCDAREVLKKSKAEILLNYLPVGSQEATEFYAGCCLNTGVSLINCIPVFIASHPYWSKRFEKRGIPIIGDDVKSQLGATITHRALTKLFQDRGVKLERTYQLNTGGNTDFLNMLNQNRLKSKKISKTEAVQSQMDEPLAAENIHIGPSDYIPWQNDNKVCFIRMEGMGFAGVPLHLEMRLSVEDSPNSGGVTIDAIRYCKIARESGDKGVLLPISAYTMKHPPKQIADLEARALIEKYITEYNAQKSITSPLTLSKTY